MASTQPHSASGNGGINVNDAERIGSVALGSLLALHGLKRFSLGGLLEAAIGGALIQRGATGHCAVYEQLGVSTAEGSGSAAALPEQHSIHVEQAYTINRSAEDLYRFWRKLDNLPSFMKHLESVQVLSDTRSHWRTSGPAGTHAEWDAEITDDVPNERIAWRSLEGSDVANRGSIRFRAAPDGRGTEVHVELEYAPPAGRLGATVARLFGENAEQQLRDDLRRFKQLMEAGEVPTTSGQPKGSAE